MAQEMKHTMNELLTWQNLPLDIKILMTQLRIRWWVNEFGEDGVYISFSGGKDSTVLLDIARKQYPNIKAVFVDTGLEYPEIREFVKTFDNVDWLRPSKTFRQVIEEYGYPFVSKEVSDKVDKCKSATKNGKYDNSSRQKFEGTYKDKDGNVSRFNIKKWKFLLDAPYDFSAKCCDVMKKKPAKTYEKETDRKPILATMASESFLRQTNWLRHGCNAYGNERPTSQPMSFWTEQDVLEYIVKFNLPICSVYGKVIVTNLDELLDEELSLADKKRGFYLKTTGCQRTGCMFCGYGCHREKPGEGRFELMKETHPKQYDYIMRAKEQGGLNYKEVIDWLNENGNLNIRY